MNHDVLDDTAASVLRVDIPIGPGLSGDLVVPARAIGVTLFAHGSGSSRFSPRNRYRRGASSTAAGSRRCSSTSSRRRKRRIVPTSSTSSSSATASYRRPAGCSSSEQPKRFLPASSVPVPVRQRLSIAAAQLGSVVRAVVSRGGRPDLAYTHLARVDSPTLLIVGGDDEVVLELNRRALAELTCERRLAIVRGASHLFEEPGTLERVAVLAGDWLSGHLAARDVRATTRSEVEIVDPVDTP